MAKEKELDLVEIVAKANPPVCRIMNYGKYLYQKNKRAHEAKKHQKQIQVKEIKLRPGTDKSDYDVKLRNVLRFLEQGDKTKITLRFRGREMVHQDLGVKLLQRVREDLNEVALVEQEPKLEGRQLTMVMAPRKRN
jgi:translation initiation factor IF-3